MKPLWEVVELEVVGVGRTNTPKLPESLKTLKVSAGTPADLL